MREVNLAKSSVLERLRENRIRHEEIYKEALEGYRVKAIELFTQALELAQSGGKITEQFDLTPPLNYLAQYDTVIDMLEMSIDTEVKLSQAEFNQYMRDEWVWKDIFMFTNSSYSSIAAGKAG